VLKRVLGEVQRLEKALKKRSIRLTVKTIYWPLWHIVELGD
jgi:hypothetical protein